MWSIYGQKYSKLRLLKTVPYAFMVVLLGGVPLGNEQFINVRQLSM